MTIGIEQEHRMAGALPAWFEADHVFNHNGSWYFGSLKGLHVGPYPAREIAETKSLQAAHRLRRSRTDAQRLRYVRELLRTEWDQVLLTTDTDGEDEIVECIDISPPPLRVRRGEEPRTWFRSNRFFQVDGYWFFATREGIDVGPFDTEDEAHRHEEFLISRLTRAGSDDEAYRIIYEHKHRLMMD